MEVFTDTTWEIFGTQKASLCQQNTQSCCFTFIHLIIPHFHAKPIIIFTLTPAAFPMCVYVCSTSLIFIIRWVSLGYTLVFIKDNVSFIHYLCCSVRMNLHTREERDADSVFCPFPLWLAVLCYSWTESFPAAGATRFDKWSCKTVSASHKHIWWKQIRSEKYNWRKT